MKNSHFAPIRGAIIFFGRGVPNLQKVGANKIVTSLFQQQKFHDPPPITDTPYPLKRLKLDKHIICGHLVTPYILVIKNLMTPYFSFQKVMIPSVYLGPPSFQRQ